MKKLLFLICLLLIPLEVQADNLSLFEELTLLSTGSSATVTEGSYFMVPANISRWYIKITATEDVAGSITVNLKGNEAKSATNEITIDTQALTVTSLTRVLDASASGQDELPVYIQADTTSISGTWTIVVQLYYSTEAK